MQPTDSGSPEKAIAVAVIGQEQQASAQARGLLRTFSALRHRNYRLFFFGQMISQIGTWMQTTAQAWLGVAPIFSAERHQFYRRHHRTGHDRSKGVARLAW